MWLDFNDVIVQSVDISHLLPLSYYGSPGSRHECLTAQQTFFKEIEGDLEME